MAAQPLGEGQFVGWHGLCQRAGGARKHSSHAQPRCGASAEWMVVNWWWWLTIYDYIIVVPCGYPPCCQGPYRSKDMYQDQNISVFDIIHVPNGGSQANVRWVHHQLPPGWQVTSRFPGWSMKSDVGWLFIEAHQITGRENSSGLSFTKQWLVPALVAGGSSCNLVAFSEPLALNDQKNWHSNRNWDIETCLLTGLDLAVKPFFMWILQHDNRTAREFLLLILTYSLFTDQTVYLMDIHKPLFTVSVIGHTPS